MIYHHEKRVEFNHCDPAGIVFYPRYFEMTNSVAENFFREVCGYSYAQMMADFQGVPTAHLEADFHAPSRLGDVLDWRLQITRVGGGSLAVTMEAWCGAERRVTARIVLVFAGTNAGKPAALPWPRDLRRRLQDFAEAADS